MSDKAGLWISPDATATAVAVGWTRAGTTIAPTTAGDLVDLGTGGTTSSGKTLTGHKHVVFADSPYALGATDSVLLVDTTGGAVTIELDTIANMAGRHVLILDWVDNAAVANITIDGNGAEHINGVDFLTINTAGGGAYIYCDGTVTRTIQTTV
jgi:hypothetical protein